MFGLFNRKTGHKYNHLVIFFNKIFFGRKKRVDFYKTLAMMLGSGFDIGEALDKRKQSIIKYRRKYFNHEDYLIQIIDDITYRYKALGMTFSTAIRPYIPANEYLILTASGSGDIGGSLINMITISLRLGKLNSAIIKAMIKPTILLTAVVVLMIFSAKVVMPSVIDSLPSENLPEFTASFNTFNQVFLHYFAFIFVFFIVFILSLIQFLPKYSGKYRKIFFDLLPMFSIYKSITAIRFMVSMSLLLNNGTISINNALSTISKSATPYLNSFVKGIMDKLNQGGNPGDALATSKLFDRKVSGIIDIYTNSGKLREGLDDLTYTYLEEQIAQIEIKFNILSALSMFLTAIYLCAFMWSIYSIGIDAAAMAA